ncbi:MAG: ComF family protein, partial [Firmicutes bacterium]|nr:ComF family protein [Bacillota bacterium]
MKDAFICRAGRRLRGKTILLIDDILTTGATASGCSTALLQGGAAGVYVLTVATVAGYK